MEHFASTDTLIKMLEDGTYKRPVMTSEAEEGISDPEKFFTEALDAFKDHMSDPDRYGYLDRRHTEDEIEMLKSIVVM